MRIPGRLRRAVPGGVVALLALTTLVSVPAVLETASPAAADCPPDGCDGSGGGPGPHYEDPVPAECQHDEFTMVDPDLICPPRHGPDIPPPPEEHPSPPPEPVLDPEPVPEPIEEVIVYASQALSLPLPEGLIRTPIAEHHSQRAAIDFASGPDDKKLPIGTAVRAVEGGRVRHITTDTCGTGIQIENGTHQWLYCHLSSRTNANGNPIVDRATVLSGEQIGLSGATGFKPTSAGLVPVESHLHLQVRTVTAAQSQCEPRPSCLPPLRCPHPIIRALIDGTPRPRVEDLPFYPCVR